MKRISRKADKGKWLGIVWAGGLFICAPANHPKSSVLAVAQLGTSGKEATLWLFSRLCFRLTDLVFWGVIRL